MAPRRSLALPLATLVLLSLAPAALAATTLTPGVKEVSQDAVTVTWGRTQDLCFSSYDIQWRPAGGSSWATETSVTDAGRTDYRLTGLNPETAYEVRVVDVDCVGNQPSDPVPFTTTALRAGGLTDFQLQLAVGGAVVAAVVAVVVLLRARARRAQVENAELIVRLDPADQRIRDCVSCGRPVTSQYCGRCGAKQW